MEIDDFSHYAHSKPRSRRVGCGIGPVEFFENPSCLLGVHSNSLVSDAETDLMSVVCIGAREYFNADRAVVWRVFVSI